MPIKLNLRGLAALKKQIPSFSSKLLRKIAKATPEVVVKNIQLGRTGIYPGNSLPQNKVSTKRRKLAKGNGDKPLQDDLFLTDDEAWRVRKRGKNYAVLPPANRAVIVGYLSEGVQGGSKYKILEMPRGYFPGYAREIMVASFNKFMSKYT